MKSCFIIRRDHEPALYITPFVNAVDARTWNEGEEVRWYSSTLMSTHEKDDALFTLYTQIDKGVDRWIQDARYFPRLLTGAAVFLIAYFFFSLAIRDPVPMVDELIIASGLTIAVTTYISKRDKKSDLAMKRRMELKQNASRADFELLEGLSAYEEYLTTCSYLDTLDLADRLAMTGNADLPELVVPEHQQGEWQRELGELLLQHVRLTDRQLYARYLRVMSVRVMKKGDEALSARLLKYAMSKEIDLPLLALLVAAVKR